jgi:hypothetical protein
LINLAAPWQYSNKFGIALDLQRFLVSAKVVQVESKPNSFEFAETQPTFATAKLWSNVY